MSSAAPPPPPAPRRIPRQPRPPIEITFEDSSSVPPSRAATRNSLYHVQKALVSPRVLTAVAVISGWAWAGAQYIAGSARQSDLDTAVQRIDALQQQVQQIKVDSTTALDVGRQCVAQQGAAALAMKALVGQVARGRGRSETQKHNEQVAAESRFSLAISEGRPFHEAVRVGLTDD